MYFNWTGYFDWTWVFPTEGGYFDWTGVFPTEGVFPMEGVILNGRGTWQSPVCAGHPGTSAAESSAGQSATWRRKK